MTNIFIVKVIFSQKVVKKAWPLCSSNYIKKIKMEPNGVHFRAIIFKNLRRGLTQQKCIDELTSTPGDAAPSRTTVYHWFTNFNRGHSFLKNKLREDRPKSVAVRKNMYIHMYMNLNISSARLYGSSKMNQIQQKLLLRKALRSKRLHGFSERLNMSLPFI